MQGRGLVQALDRRGFRHLDDAGRRAVRPWIAADAGSRGHRPHVLPLRDALKSRGHGFTGWPMRTPAGASSLSAVRIATVHGAGASTAFTGGCPSNVARMSPPRRRPTRRAEAPRAEIGNMAKPLGASEELRAGLSRPCGLDRASSRASAGDTKQASCTLFVLTSQADSAMR
jgi:hypothetical protein